MNAAPSRCGIAGLAGAWLLWLDEARRHAGRMLDAAGLGVVETPFRVIAEFPGARVRSYRPADAGERPTLLIIAAPFKRAYIWDLMPTVSVVRRCLAHGLGVYLIEWTMPTADMDGLGLPDYADRLIGAAIDAVEAETGRRGVVLTGHSLGGTLAAIFASLDPDRVRGLVLVDAPLSFGEAGDPLAQITAAMPHANWLQSMVGSPVPGSAINCLCACAVPEVFLGQPAIDFARSLMDPEAMAIHALVRRWTLDEFPLPGQLFEDAFELLYRDNRFMRGSLPIGERRASIEQLRGPVLAVVNPAGGIVPPMSILSALGRMQLREPPHILTYQHDPGPALQHLGPLVAPIAHQRLWPNIADWVAARG